MRFQLVHSLLLLLFAVPACDKVKELAAKAKPASKPAVAAKAMPVVQELEAAGYDDFIATPGQLMVVDFHADWCGPCKMLGPVLEQVAGEFGGKVGIGKINVDHAKELAGRLGVRGIPDVRLYRDGKEVARFVGAVDAAKVRQLFEKHSEGLQLVEMEEAKPDGTAPAPAEPSIQRMKKDWLPPGIERR